MELFSASEIIANGWEINLNDYPEEFDFSRSKPIFALGADNFIIEYYTSGGKN